MKKVQTLSAIIASGIYLSAASAANAVICNPVLKNCTSSTAPKAYVNNVLSVVFSIFFIVAVIYFIWHFIFAGYHLIASDGDPKKWESGKNEMVWAGVGLGVVFSVFAILKFIGLVFGIPGLSALTITWPTL
ncbi:MAG: hypothetical protein WC851_05205 [Candidatus Shapirobacteria bacterium]|jgi:hypothetical protein